MAVSPKTVLVIRALAALGKPQTANNLFKVLPRSVFPSREALREEALTPATDSGITHKKKVVLDKVPKRPRKMKRRNPHYLYSLAVDHPGMLSKRERVCVWSEEGACVGGEEEEGWRRRRVWGRWREGGEGSVIFFVYECVGV